MATFSPFATCSSQAGICAVSLYLLSLLLPSPALASSMPAADRVANHIALASGPALAAEWNLAPRWTIGASLATPWYFWQDFGSLRYGTFGMVQLLEIDGFFIAGIVGLYGDLNFGDLDRYAPLGLQLGAAFAYQLNPKLTLRLNLVPGVSLRLPPNGWVIFPPAGGAEIAWRWSPNLEVTAGYNGNGDILGLNWIF